MDKKFYNKYGYYLSKSLIPLSCIEEIQSDIQDLLTTYFRQSCMPLPEQVCLYGLLKKLFDHDPSSYGEFVKMTGVISRLPCVQLLQFHPAIIEILQILGFKKYLIPTTPVANIFAQDMVKDGNFFGLEAHQDWPSMQGSLDSIIAWIPLSHIYIDTNPLEIVTQSHRAGLSSQTVSSHHYHTVDKYTDQDFQPLEVAPGDVVFMSAFTVHRTGKKGRPNFLRSALSFRYDNPDEPFFISRLYPTAYRRSVDREIKPGHTPRTEQVQAIFM